MRVRTQVGIVGAGPAGLVLANVLRQAGIDCVVFEKHSRAYAESRARAGAVEHRTVGYLDRHGLSTRLRAHGTRHSRCEFRYQGERFSVPYGELAGGCSHYVYPQQFLVRDLADAFLADGGTIHYSTPVSEMRPDPDGPGLRATAPDGEVIDLDCDFIAGCDGFHGVARATVPPADLDAVARRHEFGWLAVLAEAPPSTEEIVYAMHEDGFAGHMLRTPTVSRYYVQCPVGDTVENWDDARVWESLERRLAVPGWQLTTGPIIEKSVLEMRSYVARRMDHGRLYLAGDAAHIITPAGGKGMNLAIADVAELAAGLAAYYAHGEAARLKQYTCTCLARVWPAQEFSHWMLQLRPEPNGEITESAWRPIPDVVNCRRSSLVDIGLALAQSLPPTGHVAAVPVGGLIQH